MHFESPVSVTVGTWDPKRALELKNALVVSGRPRVCKAILTDFDLSAYLQDYFAADHSDARSLSCLRTLSTIPLDDLWAFFYTAVWATLFHARRPSTEVLPMSSQEITWRLHLRIVQVKDFQKQFPPMLRAMAPHKASTTGGVGLPDFNHLAYSGVQDFIRIFTNHRERLARAGDD
ncbi:hypothetical protein B0H10DRAFT_2116691 [Mycena sp. CBHHK59/15]|nr:hypothetical protein B0H10DRAFT_2116691 [Mycena sp. CBHHK59/15]